MLIRSLSLTAALIASSPALAYCPGGFGCPVVIYQPPLSNLDPSIPLAAGQIPQSFQQGMDATARQQQMQLQNQILRRQLRALQQQQ